MRVRVLAASAMIATLSTAALAADYFPSATGVPPVVPTPTWSGLYIGAEGGWGWGSAEQTDVTPWSSGTFHPSGALVGGTIGYNWQFDNVVFGLEGDGAFTWIKGSTFGDYPANAPCYLPNCSANLQALGTGRGRLGIAFNQFLPYITGGVAAGSLKGQEGFLGGIQGGGGTATVVGWTVGGGVEGQITPNWSAKVEYLHVDLGDHGIFDAAIPSVGVFSQHVRFTSEIVRAGINYKFNLFGPSAPAYPRY